MMFVERLRDILASTDAEKGKFSLNRLCSMLSCFAPWYLSWWSVALVYNNRIWWQKYYDDGRQLWCLGNKEKKKIQIKYMKIKNNTLQFITFMVTMLSVTFCFFFFLFLFYLFRGTFFSVCSYVIVFFYFFTLRAPVLQCERGWNMSFLFVEGLWSLVRNSFRPILASLPHNISFE